MASTSRVSGLTITGTTFSGNQFGIYQANDGNTSRLSGMEISGSTFTGNTSYAIYVEELRDSTIENSTFTSNGVAFLLLKIYSTSGVAASDITIQGNTFSGHTGTVLDIEVRSSGLEGTLSVVDNTITQNVGVHTSTGRSAIFLWLRSTFVHGPTYVTDNTIHLTGTFATSTSAHGIRVRGNGPVYLSGNELDGGNVGGSGTTPPTTGLYIEVASTDPMTADAVVDASCNTITGFRNGVSMFNSTAADYGDLPAGATVTLGVNDISGNSDAGVRNGGSSTALDAIGSWWGCTAGPGNPGCDSVVGAVLVAPHLTVPPSCSPSGPCPSAPVTGCQDGATGKGLLAMSIKPGDPAKSKLGWKWGKGAATTKAEFGAPKTTTDYRLCVYDGDGVRQLSLRAPAGGTCAGKDCWKETRKGFKYKDKEATPDGIVALALTEGVAGKAKIGLVAKGALLTLPSLPLAQSSPVRVQLLNSGTSSCWQASYTLPAGTKPGITSKWKDKND